MAGHRGGFLSHCQFLPALESFPVDNSARHAAAWIMKLPKEASVARYGFGD